MSEVDVEKFCNAARELLARMEAFSEEMGWNEEEVVYCPRCGRETEVDCFGDRFCRCGAEFDKYGEVL